MTVSLEDIRQLSAKFAEQRNWQQFQSPKNLAMALSVEVAELVELFQWQTEEQSRNPDPQLRQAAADEIADILLYLVRIADQLAVDIPTAVVEKSAKNEQKYPVEKASGSASKYTQYQD